MSPTHEVHTPPAVPHVVAVVAWQIPSKQQPEGQFVESHPVHVPP